SVRTVQRVSLSLSVSTRDGVSGRCPSRRGPGRKDRGHRGAEGARQSERRGDGGQGAPVLHLVHVRAVEAGARGELGVRPAALRQEPYQGVAGQRRHGGGSASCQIDSTGTSSAAATRCATASCGLW